MATKAKPEESKKPKADKEREPLPDLRNATPGYLADELGRTRVIKNNAERLEKWLREGLLAKMGKAIVQDGEEYRATVSETSQNRWDTEALQRDFGDDSEFLAKYKKDISFKTVATKKLDPADTVETKA